LDGAALERLALRYVERYATTRAKLGSYLRRKLKERGWSDGSLPDVGALVERLAELRYVDDASFAATRAASLVRRGYGPRRVSASLKAAGIDDEDAAEAENGARDAALEAALTYARRKKIGPFATAEMDRAAREKAFAALLRAGHSFEIARQIVESAPGTVPQLDQG
jgi:regulatory protein